MVELLIHPARRSGGRYRPKKAEYLFEPEEAEILASCHPDSQPPPRRFASATFSVIRIPVTRKTREERAAIENFCQQAGLEINVTRVRLRR